MIGIIDYALEGLKDIKPGSNNLFDREIQVLYYETIERELDNMSEHREEV